MGAGGLLWARQTEKGLATSAKAMGEDALTRALDVSGAGTEGLLLMTAGTEQQVSKLLGALRLSLGRTTTDAEIDEAARVVPEVLRRLIDAAPRPSRVVAG